MATNTNVNITVKVIDGASASLQRVAKRTEQVGKSAKKAKVDFIGFNRTLFTATAFAGMFTKAFQGVVDVLDIGTKFDRTVNQFERVLGPKGELVAAIKATTDNSIDLMASLEAGVSLKSLGIVKNTKQLANIVSMAGTAAKLAGKDSAEGIKAYSQFMKTGAISHLQFLNLIADSNQDLAAQMAILRSAGGTMGRVLQLQEKMALGQKLLRAATIGQLKGQRDLRDVLEDSKIAFSVLRMETGNFLASVLGPFIDKMTLLADRFSTFLEQSRKAKDGFFFLMKSTLALTGAVGALAATFGTLRLGVIALQSLGFGIPGLVLSFTALGATLLGITSSADGIIGRLKLLGNFIKGVYQLVTSLDKETGIATIDTQLKKLLEENNLFIFAQNMARTISVVIEAFNDVYDVVKTSAMWIDDKFGGAVRGLIDLANAADEPWSKFWISQEAGAKRFVRVFGTIAAMFLGWKAIKGFFGGVRDGFFGGGTRPKGTMTDPIHVVNALGPMGQGWTAGLPQKGIFGKIFDWLKKKAFSIGVGGMFFKDFLVGFFKNTFTKLSGLRIVPFVGGLIKGFFATLVGKLLAAFGIGYGVGSLIEKFGPTVSGTTEEGFTGGLFERGFFKMFGDTEQERRRNRETQLMLAASGVASKYGEKGQIGALQQAIIGQGRGIISGEGVSVPKSFIEREAMLKQEMEGAGEAQKKAMTEAFREAKLASGEQGSFVSAEEYREAIERGFLAALQAGDLPTMFKKIADNTEKDTASKMSTRRNR